MSHKKILISGASIAGPTLAFWLNRFGFEVTIVERAESLRLGGQNVDIKGAAQKIAQWMGIEEEIRAADTGELGVLFVDENDVIKAALPKGPSGIRPTRFLPPMPGFPNGGIPRDQILLFIASENLKGIVVPDLTVLPGFAGTAAIAAPYPNAGLDHPDLLAAVDKIHAAAKRAGKFTVMHCNPIDYAQRMQARGFSLRTVSNDTRLLAMAAQDLLRQLKPGQA